MANQIKLHGKVFITGNIKAVTGLHIGGSDSGISIGGIDNPVIKNTRTNQPYIPGSSIKGKMRSLLEKIGNRPQNARIGRINIHLCDNKEDYDKCDVCHIFGVTGDKPYSSPTRLIVRDVMLDTTSLEGISFTEIKTEASIDRVTSAAVPRSIERVPEGAIFKDFEFCYSVYEEEDLPRLKKLFEAMQLLEDDYLGGSGSRGNGKVKFIDMKVQCRPGNNYGKSSKREEYTQPVDSMEKLLDKQNDIVFTWLKDQFFKG